MPGPQELLVIAVVAMLVFGPERLPELARNAAKALQRLRNLTDESVGELKRAAEAEGLDREWKAVSRDLRQTRDQLRRPFDEPDRKPVSKVVTGTPGPAWRADDDPPPVDTEAT